jgi:L-rhamnose-H+ transport protein
MTENWIWGMTLVMIAGAMQGTYMLPTKFTRRWNWENMWFSFSTLAYLIFPWAIAVITVPQLMDILSQTSASTFGRVLLFGFGWGLGALTFGLGINAVGLALGFAIILGLTTSIGTLVPLFVLSDGNVPASQFALILIGVAVMLLGISICAWAGKQKEDALKTSQQREEQGALRKSYGLGLVFCLLSGIFSPFGNLGFAFGTEITSLANNLGTPAHFAAIPFWAVIIVPMFVCNIGFSLYLLRSNQSFTKFRLPKTKHYHLLTASMGLLWLVGMIIYGVGATKLGPIGPSIGWAVLMSLIVIVANLWGLVTGEWRGTGRKPIRTMILGLSFLLVAIFVIGLSNI